MGEFSVRTSAFTHGEAIQTKFTCEGDDVSPSLTVGDVPDDAESLAVVVDDPDAPTATFTHWLLWNLPPDTVEIHEDVPQTETVGTLDGAVQGTNDFGELGYRGPCPPEGDGAHEYRFTAVALDETLDLDPGAKRRDLDDAMGGAEIASARFTGTFER
ncbi:YbhB/YbcL family Raf kinase inhibitor-like protein [Halomicrococcus sp. SG-WS-1]|uniref:YbhB/YbcL family Raf kinase inhibitor-like protein n=1 Tax=Halomicrococcus sp. SG-WS-1 TaxID=3439057 RepID=UPI003F7B18C1